ncbi:MAG: EI24 domain-containing protein [Alphaproteobacteria bacterium]
MIGELLHALIRAFGDIFLPEVRRYLACSFALGAALFAGLLALAAAAFATTRVLESSWFEWILDALGGFAALALAVLLFPAILGLASSCFLEAAAEKIERHHYRAPGPVRGMGLGEAVWVGFRFFLLLAGVNVLALPFYLLLIWLPPLNVLLYAVLNGFLLGREYFEFVALRHLEPDAARALWRRHRRRLWLAGSTLAAIAMIPALNLLMPLIATAFMVHIYQDIRGQGGSQK